MDVKMGGSLDEFGFDGYSNDTEMVGLIRTAFNMYVGIVDKISDPRTSHWMFMQTPVPTILMVGAYLNFVLLIGPKLMENRKPFQLRELLVVYNGFQVLLSVYMTWEHLMGGWWRDYNFQCQAVDYSYNETALRMAELCWVYYISKLTEFSDTVFFVLRKKSNQLTFLHLYHHSLTPFMTWVLVKFVAGGHGTFSNLINNIVHVIMYFYYMVSAMGPKYQKYLWWKKYLTSVQLLQFFVVFLHSIQILFYDCGYPRLLGGLLALHSTIFLGLFSHFYYKTYNRSGALKQD